MATQTLYTFNADTGYTYDSAKTEFTAGVMRLKSSIGAGNDTVTAPTSTFAIAAPWFPEIVTVEPVGYFHKFLVSFDAGVTWNTYDPSGWRRVYAQSDVVAYGIPAAEFALIREWPDWLANTFRLTIYMEREASGGNGSIGNFDMTYGAAVYAVAGEPAYSGDTLEPSGAADANGLWLGLMPDTPYDQTFMDCVVEFPLAGGYRQTIKTGGLRRGVFRDLRWAGRTAAEMDTVVDFLRAHRATSFDWTPQGEGAARYFIASDPVFVGAGVFAREIRASFIEVFSA